MYYLHRKLKAATTVLGDDDGVVVGTSTSEQVHPVFTRLNMSVKLID